MAVKLMGNVACPTISASQQNGSLLTGPAHVLGYCAALPLKPTQVLRASPPATSPLTCSYNRQVAMEVFHLSSDAANLSLGVVTIVCALVGILGGGETYPLLPFRADPNQGVMMITGFGTQTPTDSR